MRARKPLFVSGNRNRRSEEPRDPSVFIHINLFGSRNLRKSRHGHNVSSLCHQEARSRGNLDLPNRNFKSSRCAHQILVVGEAELRLCHADRKFVKAQLRKPLNLLLRLRRKHHAVAAINILYNGIDLFFYGRIQLIRKLKVPSFFRLAKANHFFCQLHASVSAL